MPIKKLSDHIANQIAAGEVVERPASVVKELVENALDAGAKSIMVRLEAGGQQLIEIIDNGLGIAAEDFPLLFERHATSKIATLEDLQAIVSMGFRGEALASISSVADVTVTSTLSGETVGHTINKAGDSQSELVTATRAAGTTVTVKNLFYNVPAREKYLKTANTEYKHVVKIIDGLAAGYPEISFKLEHDGDLKIDYPGGSLLDRSLQILALDSDAELFPVFYQSQDMHIEGYVGKPQQALKRKQKQFVAVNQRPLNVYFIDKAVKDAMHTLIPHDYYPIYLLQITIDPQAVDMNVHPRKLEARFAYQQFVYQKVKAAVKAATEKHILTANLQFGEPERANYFTPKGFTPAAGTMAVSEPRTMPQTSAFSQPRHASVENSMAFNQSFSGLPERQHQPLVDDLAIKPLAQLDQAYMVAVDENGIVIIDQHAAHERIMYAKLQQARAQFAAEEVKGQLLLDPLDITLTSEEAAALNEHLEALRAVGFDFELLNTDLLVKSVPSVLQREDLAAVVKGVVSDITDNSNILGELKDMEARIERVINYTACRSAIKFGQSLNLNEQAGLLSELETAEQNYTCPHGRPTRIKISFKDLEKQFGR